MSIPKKRIFLSLAILSLSVLSCSYVNQVMTISKQRTIDAGLTQTALVFTATPTITPLPTVTPTPIPIDIIFTFYPTTINPVKSDSSGWIWSYTYAILNPNSYPITIVAFGDDTDGCVEDINSCSHTPVEFSEQFTKCDFSGEVISAGMTACDTGYWYQNTEILKEDMQIRNVIWYRDPGGNLFNAISEPLTLIKQSDPSAIVNSASTYLRQGPGTEYYAITTYEIGVQLTITGQANNCQWVQVLDSDQKMGWVYAPNLKFSMTCGEIPATSYPAPPPTQIPATATPSCSLNGILSIQNDTGGSVTLYLTGPASFTFYLNTGPSTLYVCPGTYSYTAHGGGGAKDRGSMSSGERHTFFCQ